MDTDYKSKFKQGDKVYFIESSFNIIEVEVLKASSDFCIIKLPKGGGIRVRTSKLFINKVDAEILVRKKRTRRS